MGDCEAAEHHGHRAGGEGTREGGDDDAEGQSTGHRPHSGAARDLDPQGHCHGETEQAQHDPDVRGTPHDERCGKGHACEYDPDSGSARGQAR